MHWIHIDHLNIYHQQQILEYQNQNFLLINLVHHDLLTRSFDADIPIAVVDDIGLDDQCVSNVIPTTNSGEVAHYVEETTIYGGSQGKLTISGHVLLNQCGSLLTRKKHELKGSSKHHFFLQRIVATSEGSSIPLMYPEGILFPSIHWKMANDNCSILGCIPAPLLSESIESQGFASIRSHIKCRVTNVSSSTSTNTKYISHCYDMLNNIAANREDTRVILNRGLTVDENSKSGLGLRGKGDSSLIGSVDNKQIVRNLCYSQKYVQWSHFLTFTCNQRDHFGTSNIKNWVDGDEWKSNYPNFYQLELDEQKEIQCAMIEASAGLLLRCCEEVFIIIN